MVSLPSSDVLAAAAKHGREISAIAAVAPEHAAIVVPQGPTISYGELDARADKIAAVFRGAGLVEGDAVALLCTNRPEWVETYLATLRLGLQLVPVNWHLQADDIAYVVADSGARALVAEAAVAGEAAIGETAELRLAVGGPLEGFDSYESAVAAADVANLPQTGRGSMMIYTSGTTGRPKGVRHGASTSDGSAIGAVMVQMFGMDATAGHQMLCPAPLYHSGPSRICCEWPLGAGVTMVLMSRFDAAEALQLITDHSISHAFFVPTMFQRMLKLPADVRKAADLSSLEFVLHGAGPITVATKQAMFDWIGRPVIHEIYAASEGPGTWITPQEWLDHPGSVGKVDSARLVIRDEHGVDAPAGEVGTVWFRSTAAFEYHGDPDKTAATFDDTREWYTVGDRGHVDVENYLYLAGRSAEVIVSGGVNIYPARIDEALQGHPQVVDAAAFGMQDDEYGEVVHAAVVLAKGVASDAEVLNSIRQHCRNEVGGQMTPVNVHVVDHLPRSDAGKLYRQRLVESFHGRNQ